MFEAHGTTLKIRKMGNRCRGLFRFPGYVLDPEYKVLLGLWSTGKREEAVAKIEEYVARVPESLEGRYRLGVRYEESGKLDEAERCFRWVLDRYATLAVYEPAVSLSQLHVGHVLDLRSRRDEAKEAYQKRLSLPDESDSHKEATALLVSPFQPVAPRAGPGPELLVRFAGSYDNRNGIVLKVTLEEAGVLMVEQPGKSKGPLEWIDGSRFRVAGAGDIILEFAGEPRVDALDLKVSDKTIHLLRAK